MILIVLFLYGIIRHLKITRSALETGMLLEDLKQELTVVRTRIETLRRHL